MTATGALLIEGRAGEGDAFMKGEVAPEKLPSEIVADVEDLYGRAHRTFGPVRFEWVHDGTEAWIVQLHRGITESDASIVVPGDAERWADFDVADGLGSLRDLLRTLDDRTGIVVRGTVGLTSHIADVIRRARIPARIEASRD